MFFIYVTTDFGFGFDIADSNISQNLKCIDNSECDQNKLCDNYCDQINEIIQDSVIKKLKMKHS
ncbi:hypothetical protein BpHYR1_012508 [Brachionus plicatilis]|uniref:Uncharacterized protein n=1 Tax=Brachionus plicatilis TaxID=10195 RepID=A0A3M7QK80_BRAPC|nr:hypothetical protein BpHYR1_012508 [Brachionus plicatilis]